ncbi:small ribosomal subunit protein bS16m-like [Diadema setosum]|uniref:small ribosomal subunit protein bS16m-like n=1 Tax=Diadema setosum TaxID=31175 RepID=UPI003B3A0C33
MVVVMRLARFGCTNRPFFHIVVIHNKFARNSGRALEQLGTYDPMPNNHNEKLISLNVERIKFWLASGAQPSTPVSHLLGLSGLLPVHPRTYVLARRARHKTAMKEKEAAAAAENENDEDN